MRPATLTRRGRLALSAVTLAVAAVMGGTAVHVMRWEARTLPASCTFDGGGTIGNAQLATTSQGTTWVCDNGTLAQVFP